MIKKEIKEYKQGNDKIQRINILKRDNIKGTVYILEDDEYKNLTVKADNYVKFKEINEKLNQTINILNKKLEDENKNVLELTTQIQNKNNKIATLEIDTKILQDQNKTINELKKEITETDKRNGKLIVENTELSKKIKHYTKELEDTIANQELRIKEYEINERNIEQIETIYKKTFENITKQQDKTIENINTKHQDQLKQIYDKFNKDLTKYIAVNQLQNTALKQILELGFIDLIRNKHKKIAKDQIKELDTKPVYELAKKE